MRKTNETGTREGESLSFDGGLHSITGQPSASSDGASVSPSVT